MAPKSVKERAATPVAVYPLVAKFEKHITASLINFSIINYTTRRFHLEPLDSIT